MNKLLILLIGLITSVASSIISSNINKNEFKPCSEIMLAKIENNQLTQGEPFDCKEGDDPCYYTEYWDEFLQRWVLQSKHYGETTVVVCGCPKK